MLLLCQQGGIEERDLCAQDIQIAGYTYIAGCHVGEPEQVIGDTGANSSTGWRMPPMLDIPFFKLTAGSQQQMFPRQFRPGIEKGHDILQLIAETEGAARLVKGAAPPDPAT